MNVFFFISLTTILINRSHCWSDDNYNQNQLISSQNSLGDNRIFHCAGLRDKSSRLFEILYYKLHSHGMDEKKIKFYYTSRRNNTKNNRENVVLEKKLNLNQIDFKIERRTIIIVHGFLSHGRESWIREMENALLLWDDVNIITVDWGAIATTWNYYDAAVHTEIVGRVIVKLLTNIINSVKNASSTAKINWGPIHMIGHSLGSHICSVVAYELRKMPTVLWQVRRITGLDPAQPCFISSDMHKSDAMFVDIIHTNGRLLEKLGLGLPNPIGHMDFYPDGGMVQLNCSPTNKYLRNILNLFGLFIESSIITAICSHGRAHDYFTESIIEAHYKNGSFVGKPWDRTYKGALKLINVPCKKNQCPEMGINAEKYPQRGSFFVETSRSPPYSAVKWSDLKNLKHYLEDNIQE